jgi:phosphohistidine phosphatase
MYLYFVRHGDASNDARSDRERPLTEKGKKRTQQAASVLAALAVAPAAVYSSPRVRARQTAAILARALDASVTIRDEMDFDFSPLGLHLLIENHAPDAEILLVGHNPSISEVVNALTGASISMRKGAIACVELPQGASVGGELLWLMPPRLFKALVSIA